MGVGNDVERLPEAARRVLAEPPDSTASRRRLKRRLRFFAQAAALLLIFFGLATLSGSFRGNPLPGIWFPGGKSIANSTSLLVVTAGISLWFWTRRPLRKWARWTARIFGFIVFVSGMTSLVETFLGIDFGVDPLSFLDVSGMPQVTVPSYAAAALAAQGLALVFLDRIFSRHNRPAEYLALLGGLLGFISLLSYTYGLQGDQTFTQDGEMSFPASILILFLSFGIILAKPAGIVGSIFASPGMAGTMIRRLAVALTLAPALLGWLRLLAESRRWVTQELGAALAAGGYILIFGTMILSLGWMLHRTERRRRNAERLLLSREGDARAAFEYAPRGIGQIDSNGRWLRINNQLCKIFGYSRGEFMALTLPDILAPDDMKECTKSLGQLLRGEISQFSLESRYLKKEGSVIWCNVTVTVPQNIPRSRRAYAIAVVEDVTVRKQAQLEIARQKATAEAANMAKDRLISIISHELRTPLTPVLAAISSAPMENLNDEQRKTVQMMRRNLEHEVCLIDDLLDLTRVTHGKLRLKRVPVDLHALITEVFEGIRPSLTEKGLSSRLLLNAARHNVRGDPARLRQILLNLLDNAKKFTPAGGYITVSTSQKGNRIVTRVLDTGVGIEPKVIGRIFDAFEQGEQSIQRRFGGLGLGLSISRGLAEAHGGSLRVESLGLGRGSTFIFELIAIDQPATVPTLRPTTESRGVNVLLVEDHEDTRVTLHRLLERRGHHVVSASCLAGALELARREPLDILISDIGLPDGSGLSLPKAVNKVCGHPIPGIALSGFGRDEDISLSSQAGFARHLVKPVEVQTLIEAIQETVPPKAA